MSHLRRPDFGEDIAFCAFTFQAPDGSKQAVRLRIGKPYMIAETEWACPLEIHGFEPRQVDIRGADALQALGLTMSFARKRMEHFLTMGGRILYPDGEPYTLESLQTLFGR